MAPFPSATKVWHTEAYSSIFPTRPELSARGKNVIVTGGGTGIGAETARSFAQAGAARIALLGRREQPLLDTKASIEQSYPGVEVFTASVDVSKREEVDTACAKFLGDTKVHVLVSNAASQGPAEAIGDVDNESFLGYIDQSIRGAFFIAQAFLRHASTDAVAINVSSGTAHLNIGSRYNAYSVSKMAIFRLWDTLAFANPNLHVHHVQPGIVDTPGSKESGVIAATGIEDQVSLPANFHVWLASPEALFLKSKYLWANWDVDELKDRAKEIKAGHDLTIGLLGWPFNDANFSIDGGEKGLYG